MALFAACVCVSGGVWLAGVRSARLLTWQERLAALRDLLLWDHALWLGLHIYTLACPSAAKVTADSGPAAACRQVTPSVTPLASYHAPLDAHCCCCCCTINAATTA